MSMQQAKPGPTGRWYYVITIASAGMLACVPFFHAASELKRRELWKRGAIYAVIAAVAFTLFGNAPVDDSGTPVGIVANLCVIVLIGLVIAACLEQRHLRQMVYGQGRVNPAAMTAGPEDSVARIEHARRQRKAARQLAVKDPLMARELRIGRPDLAHNYDDGGLVDLNSAPAPVIARACDISPQAAEQIAHARATIGEFHSVEEAIVYANLVGGVADVLRDRALVLPAVPNQ